MKRCSRCKTLLDRSLFTKASSKADGLHPWCKSCWSAWHQENSAKRLKISADYYAANSDKIKEARRKRYSGSPDQARSAQSEWRRSNPGKAAANVAARRSRKRNAMPPWADVEMIQWIYDLARKRSEETGVLHHVDHIIPLAGKRVCGLHVQENLRIIPASENLKKGARDDYVCEVRWL